MFWLGLLFVAGGTYTAVNRGLDSPIGIGILAMLPLALILSVPFVALNWVNQQVGIDDLMFNSYMTLAGVDTPSDIVVECQAEQAQIEDFNWGEFFLSITVYLISLAILLVNLVLFLVATVGLPCGLVMSFGGGVWALITRGPPVDNIVLINGLMLLAAGTAATIVTGLSFRLIHYMTGTLIC